MSGKTFIIGMRRSGTSFLRDIVNKAPGINLLFEPRDVWFASTVGHLARFSDNPAVLCAFDGFRDEDGAKFALDPGIDSCSWPWIDAAYCGARFIFIRRNQADTYASYFAMDELSDRGAVSADIHRYFWDLLYGQFRAFADHNADRCAWIEYEDLLGDPGATLAPVWRLLGAEPVDVRDMLRMPQNTAGVFSQLHGACAEIEGSVMR